MEDLCLVCGKTVSRKNFARHQKFHSDEKNIEEVSELRIAKSDIISSLVAGNKEEDMVKIQDHYREISDLSDSIVRYKNSLTAKKQEKSSAVGPCEKMFDD